MISNGSGNVTSRNALLTVTPAVSTAGTDVVTYKNDLARTGQNLNEKTLTPANVKHARFGKLQFLSTDGKVDAQPLYLSALSIGGVKHNVVFVATENDSAYAFDADTGTQLWKVSLVPAGETVASELPQVCDVIEPTIGVTATPVIDRGAGAHGTIYLVAMTKSSTTWHQRLHALDVTTGAEVAGGPREITATYDTAGGTITFDPGQYLERAALLLLTSHRSTRPGRRTAITSSTPAGSSPMTRAPCSAPRCSTSRPTAAASVPQSGCPAAPRRWIPRATST